MVRGKLVAAGGFILLGLTGFRLWQMVQHKRRWMGTGRHPEYVGVSERQNQFPRPNVAPFEDFSDLTRRGGAGSLYTEIGAEGVAALRESPRYGGRDSGLGINGAEYQKPGANMPVRQSGEQPPPIPEPDRTRAAKAARTLGTAAGPSHPTPESSPTGPPNDRTGSPQAPNTNKTGPSADDQVEHTGEGGALGMKGAGVTRGGHSQQGKTQEDPNGN